MKTFLFRSRSKIKESLTYKIHFTIVIGIILIFLYFILNIVKSKTGFDGKIKKENIANNVYIKKEGLVNNPEFRKKLSVIINKSLLNIGMMHKYLNDKEKSIFFSLLRKGENKNLVEYKKYYRLQGIAYNRAKINGTNEEKELVKLIEEVKEFYKK